MGEKTIAEAHLQPEAQAALAEAEAAVALLGARDAVRLRRGLGAAGQVRLQYEIPHFISSRFCGCIDYMTFNQCKLI